MRDFIVLLVHLIITILRLAKPGGFRSIVAESVLIRHQLLILNRGRKRAPNLCAVDRFLAGLCTLFIRRARLLRSAIVLKPSTLLHLHQVLIRRKYRLLFSSKRGRHRTHAGLEGRLPSPMIDGALSPIDVVSYRWEKHWQGLYQTPIAA